MTEWQPIETAPKDDSNILLWIDQEPEVCAGRWSSLVRNWVAAGTNELFYYEPTHWMTPPDGPKETKT